MELEGEYVPAPSIVVGDQIKWCDRQVWVEAIKVDYGQKNLNGRRYHRRPGRTFTVSFDAKTRRLHWFDHENICLLARDSDELRAQPWYLNWVVRRRAGTFA